MAFQKERIYQAIRQAVQAGPYHAVAYDADSKALSAGAEVQPAEVLVWEARSKFSENVRMRSWQLQRVSWQWKAAAGFHQEVTSEAFERALCDAPIRIASDPQQELPSVRLVLESVERQDPFQQEPAVGSRVVFSFQALE